MANFKAGINVFIPSIPTDSANFPAATAGNNVEMAPMTSAAWPIEK